MSDQVAYILTVSALLTSVGGAVVAIVWFYDRRYQRELRDQQAKSH